MHSTSMLIFALLPVCDGLLGFGKMQSVAVTGTIRCYGIPAANVKVKLFDREVFLDKELEGGKTDRNGTFYLSGWKREFTNIDPFLNIYHKCNFFGPCYKKRRINIPNEYITYGPYPNNTFNLGIVNLESKYLAEWVDCVN